MNESLRQQIETYKSVYEANQAELQTAHEALGNQNDYITELREWVVLLEKKGDVLATILGNTRTITLDQEYQNEHSDSDEIIAALAEWEKAKEGIK